MRKELGKWLMDIAKYHGNSFATVFCFRRFGKSINTHLYNRCIRFNIRSWTMAG